MAGENKDVVCPYNVHLDNGIVKFFNEDWENQAKFMECCEWCDSVKCQTKADIIANLDIRD